MRPRLACGAAAAVLAALLGHGSASAAAAGTAEPPVGEAGSDPVVTVTLDRGRKSVEVGDRFTVRSRLENPRAAATDRLIAHLGIASLTSDVYVDPEDWSSRRTVELPTLSAGAGAEVLWEIQAVNAGRFAVYVVVLPSTATDGGVAAVSPPVHVHVSGRRTLNAGGALPVVLAVPLLLAGLLVVARVSVARD